MSTLEDVLDQLYFTAINERDKGDKFERLMLQFFKTDLQWADRFSDVWMWSDWPGRQGRPDTGIDLVATDAATGETVAIQCKFYDPTHYLQKEHIDSFLSASGKQPFAQRLIVSTTDKWGRNAEATVEDQQVPVQRLRFMDLAESSIDWSQFDLSTPEVMTLRDRKQLRPHQKTALAKVREGLAEHDRGKLIMACGTGKTFTSLRIAEDLLPDGGTVLFLVPSISLLSQSLREWSLETEADLRPFAVCSDVKVGKRTKAQSDEDISVVDLAIPATTNAARLHTQLADAEASVGKLTVVFSTYQSIAVVAEAQAKGLPDFDLVICDEAHRTTGATLAGVDESAFVKVHDPAFIRASKRLYMTATPRIYDEATKVKVKDRQTDVVLASMDDERIYGPELHRLGFGEAVSAGLLTDYKVLVLAVDEKSVSRTFQAQMADENSELKLDDVAKIVGCWNGLAKRGQLETGFATDPEPMTRAVAFARSIKDSQKFAEMFKGIVADYITQTGITDDEQGVDHPLVCDVEHVDGTFNVLARNEKLDWLKDTLGERECRVLSNARCLSEGVDVPALDSVMFLNPRKSVVDVVQSVGRVMRLAPGKKYGYIILPIGIPADVTPEQALKDNDRFAVVWEVLQALRAHDERFDAMVNKIELNRGSDDRIQIIGVGGNEPGDRDGSSDPGAAKPVQGEFVFPDLGEWRESIYAKIVQKVGSRRYWEDWAKDVALIAERHTTRITALLDDPDLPVHEQFDTFLTGLRGNLNDSISRADAIDMLAQHLITRPVFDALFEGYSFTEHNPVSQVMQAMLDTLDAYNLEAENETLEKFYESVRLRAAGIDNAAGKQQIVHELYEKFFKLAFPKTAEAFGIVYTPVEVVDFILRSVEHLLGTEFGASLSDEGVHILDPFTGTGSFVVRLLQSGLIRPHDLARKYSSEIHANEVLLLAYYIAAINIEATYHGLRSEEDLDAGYEPFNGIVLADTFQMTEDGDTLDTAVFPANHERAANQLRQQIRIVVGNPPYFAKQGRATDKTASIKYPSLDRRIKDSYLRAGRGSARGSIYDSYIRALRWASDRVGDAGIVAFVTNGGFLDSNSADGLRKSLAEEFDSIAVYNLRGNMRAANWKDEGGQIFGEGSQATVAIVFLIKTGASLPEGRIDYAEVASRLTREQKLDLISEQTFTSVDWRRIHPNADGDWLNQRSDRFASFTSLAPVRSDRGVTSLISTVSAGVKTNRDAWVYGSSSLAILKNVSELIGAYNAAVDYSVDTSDPADTAPHRVSWTTRLRALAAKRGKLLLNNEAPRVSLYRPFQRQFLYFDRELNEAQSLLRSAFPEPRTQNFGFYTTGLGASKPFSVMMVDCTADLNFWGSEGGQLFPRWTFEPTAGGSPQQGFDLSNVGSDAVADDYRRVDNVNPAAMSAFYSKYGPGVTQEDVFYYIYGILHSLDYREEFAADLKKMLPRIPKVATPDDFRAFVAAGSALSSLHLGYEAVDPYPLTVTGDVPTGPGSADLYEWFRVEKMRWGGAAKAKDRSAIRYNSRITVAGIPDEAHGYMLGSRSGIEWVMERYQVRTDKASGIVNDPNDWSREQGDPRYILDLLARVVTVSVETVRIVRGLPRLDLGTLS